MFKNEIEILDKIGKIQEYILNYSFNPFVFFNLKLFN